MKTGDLFIARDGKKGSGMNTQNSLTVQIWIIKPIITATESKDLIFHLFMSSIFF